MSWKWFGPLALLAVLVVGDQIRINRPAHKFRLTVTIDTPGGARSASGVMSVHPDRSYSKDGVTRTKGDAIFLDLGGGRSLVMLLAHLDKTVQLDDIAYVALRAFRDAGHNVPFARLSSLTGTVPVTGALIPIMVTFSDSSDPASARAVDPADASATLGQGVTLRGVTVEMVPNGFWPLDFGGVLGTPVTRDIEGRLPWLNRSDSPASIAMFATGLPINVPFDAKAAFTRK